jgi:RNA polymerase sigma-70 factor (ECF subfamily)
MHQSIAHRVAAATVGPHEAEDVVQDAFVKAYTRLHQLDRARPFRPWVLGIVTNEARNRTRSRARYKAMVERVQHHEAVIAASPTDPATTAVRTDRQQRLLDAVLRLSPAEREIVALRWFADLSEGEIADALSCARGTVKSRLHRAMARLRVELGEEASG